MSRTRRVTQKSELLFRILSVSAAPTEAWYFAHLIESFRGIEGPDELRQLHREHPSRYPFLLQSTTSSGSLGRFDILFALPGDTLELARSGELRGRGAAPGRSFLDALDLWWSDERAPTETAELPFYGGWFLYLGYELAGEIEPALHLSPDPVLPKALAVRCPTALVFDHEQGACHLVSESLDYKDRLQLKEDVEALCEPPELPTSILESVREEEPQFYTDAVMTAKDYIAAGDIYQANLSRQWSARVSKQVSGSDIYASLCNTSPAPFAGIARWQGVEIISSSPERLLMIRDGIAATRPIAGTRPRSDNETRDSTLSAELFAHPKELAEHVMLIDLERNDLGRVCEAGSVEVDEMMVLESYSHVHHIVSNVKGRLRDDIKPGQAIAAVFPGGTITGCPKVRCMQIISELERGPRGAYTGSFGYLNRDGSLDLNILIRTMVKQGNELTIRAGAGIVADSDPDAELRETRAKAKGMLTALGQ
ncbi:MAG: aminodeoxychorismate synthase component I [Gammaproteobacteria bacterium]|nr:aminodeoxychorismate synthase component I [Gammaproteobacteria bacterium]MBT8110891.1 aminodeoxychorismate synthase component I [Gammaproteobacteria bacterium]NND47073.1 aminodeoxychorismate synthase component I [Woeseiaceae bacterium]NNL45589.1 aminodeoxychorismate synthase component I [Woeseiaceae bacterium]